jgi:hypothetical protein
VVTGDDALDVRAHRLDDARSFMTGDHRQWELGHLAQKRVAVANASADDPHQQLIALRIRKLDILEGVLLTCVSQDGGGCSHGASPTPAQ